MTLKLLGWSGAVVLLVGVGVLFAINRQQEGDLAQLRAQVQEYQQEKASAEEARLSQARSENEELIRLRKDNEDLLRLRNEVRQLRDEKSQLGKQVQTAQSQAQVAQSQAQTLQAEAQAARQSAVQAAQTAQASQSALQQFQARYGTTLTPEQAVAANACIGHLRQIDGAKQQWALENRKPANSPVNASDLAPYLKNNAMPACPGGGTYSVNPVQIAPTCNLPGHTLGR